MSSSPFAEVEAMDKRQDAKPTLTNGNGRLHQLPWAETCQENNYRPLVPQVLSGICEAIGFLPIPEERGTLNVGQLSAVRSPIVFVPKRWAVPSLGPFPACKSLQFKILLIRSLKSKISQEDRNLLPLFSIFWPKEGGGGTPFGYGTDQAHP